MNEEFPQSVAHLYDRYSDRIEESFQAQKLLGEITQAQKDIKLKEFVRNWSRRTKSITKTN